MQHPSNDPLEDVKIWNLEMFHSQTRSSERLTHIQSVSHGHMVCSGSQGATKFFLNRKRSRLEQNTMYSVIPSIAVGFLSSF